MYSSRNLYIDTQIPGKPDLIKPENGSSHPDSTIMFNWIRYPQGGSSVFDSIFVYKDSLYVQLKFKRRINQTYYADSLGTGKYYWRVRSYDKAGNESEYSDVWDFNISD